VQDQRTSPTNTSTQTSTRESQDLHPPALLLEDDKKFPGLHALGKPSLFQQYQDKIFNEYMALRTGKGEGFIPVGTTFIEMEEKFLLWLRELEQLRSDAREKGTVQGDTGEIVPPETVDKCIALLWWNLVRPPISPLSPVLVPSR